MDKHKTFISFHSDDEWAKLELEKLNDLKDFFINKSIQEGDIDDSLPDEQIRRIIRKDYLADSTVTILLVGKETKNRKFIDWELQASMTDSENHKRSGILCINLPSISQCHKAGESFEKIIISNTNNWIKLSTRNEFELNFPYMPNRIIDNFLVDAKITVVDWETVINDVNKLQYLIDIAFRRRDSIKYDTHTPLRRKNS